MGADTWSDRYRGEDPAAVWAELAALGEEVRAPAVRPDARAVAAELAARVRRNVERLSERWRALGYTFGYAWAGRWAKSDADRSPPHLGAPNAADLAALDRFEAEVGPLPLALRAFYERVGAVNFVGDAPGGREGRRWPDIESFDPLQVVAFTPQLEALLESDAEPREVEICPDHLHKYFISGVGSIMARVPDPGADAVLTFEGEPLHWENEPLHFVPYLREVILRRGGIGLVEMPAKGLAKELTEGLEPF